MLLFGTVHRDNPERDVNNPTVPDVLLPEKQAALRDSLGQFRPTQMTIEVRRRHQAAIDSLYRRVRAGRMDTAWAVDHFLPLRIGNVMTHAKTNDPALLRATQKFFEASPKLRFVDPLLYL